MKIVNIALLALAMSGVMTVLAVAQDGPPAGQMGQGGEPRGGGARGVGGEITAIEGKLITLHTFRGETAQVRVTGETEFQREGAAATFGDFKVGERVMVLGSKGDDGVWVARGIGQRNGGQRNGAPGGGPGGMRVQGTGPAQGTPRPQMRPEDNGKLFISGVVTGVNGAAITVKKPDGTTQIIEADEETSFRNPRRESITLTDIKLGDTVRGPGAMKDGVFVPRLLTAGAALARGAGQGTAQDGVQSAEPSDAAPQSAPPSGANPPQ
jgi:hypothetical protein